MPRSIVFKVQSKWISRASAQLKITLLKLVSHIENLQDPFKLGLDPADIVISWGTLILAKNSWGDIPNWIYGAALSLLQSLKTVDPVTYAHCLRVGELARKLSRDAGLNQYEQKLAEYSGIFHDIGKIGISQEIIAKPGRLEPKEMDIMRTHPVISEDILKPLAEQHLFFHNLLPAVRGHHERIDGTGYPDKTLGDKIPLMARIILIVDTYDAMSETRAYRKGLPDEIVYAELRRCSGTQFDPQLVKIFLDAHQGWAKQPDDQETAHFLKKKAA